MFEDAVLSLKRNNICISRLRVKVHTRLEQEVFGYVVMQKLKNPDSQNLIKLKIFIDFLIV